MGISARQAGGSQAEGGRRIDMITERCFLVVGGKTTMLVCLTCGLQWGEDGRLVAEVRTDPVWPPVLRWRGGRATRRMCDTGLGLTRALT